MHRKRFKSPFFKKTLEPKQVFPYEPDDVAQTLAALKINGWNLQQARRALETDDLDEWLFYALHHAYKKWPQATHKDICSFAALCQSFYSGMYGGFGTETYGKEEKAEAQMLFLLNRMSEIGLSDDAKAQILLIALEDKYFKT